MSHQRERRPSVVGFESAVTVIPEGGPVKTRLATRTLSIPLTRRPSTDYMYDPTFIPSPQKSFKIPIPHLSTAPPLPHSKSRRFSHGEVEGKPLRSCLLYREQQSSHGQAIHEHARPGRKLARAISVDRASLRSDPMSVLPVFHTPTIQVTPSTSAAGQTSGRPSLSVLTGGPSSGSRTDSSPTTKSRPGMFGSFKRPSFMKRRTSSSDDKSAFGSNGASLKRWTSDSTSAIALSPTAESPSSASRIGDFDGPPVAGRGFFSEQGRGANVPPCIMEDPTMEAEKDHERHHLLKSPIALDPQGNDKYTRLRACCPDCSRATDKGLSEDWVPPVSKRAQKKLDVEHMVRQIEGKRLSGEEEDEAVDEKASSFVVDEVELLRRRRSSGGSGSNEPTSPLPEHKPVSQTCLLGLRPSSRPGSASPSSGPVWLCSGKGRSPSSGSFSRQSPADTPAGGRSATPERRSADYFGLASQDAATARAAQEDLDAKIAAALAAEASMARESTREREGSGQTSPRVETSETGARKGDWFRRMGGDGGGIIPV